MTEGKDYSIHDSVVVVSSSILWFSGVVLGFGFGFDIIIPIPANDIIAPKMKNMVANNWLAAPTVMRFPITNVKSLLSLAVLRVAEKPINPRPMRSTIIPPIILPPIFFALDESNSVVFHSFRNSLSFLILNGNAFGAIPITIRKRKP